MTERIRMFKPIGHPTNIYTLLYWSLGGDGIWGFDSDIELLLLSIRLY